MSKDNNLLLLEAANKVNVEAVKSLLEVKANPDTEDKQKQTPLHHVFLNALPKLSENCLQIAILLLINGAKVNVQNKEGDTPLILAVKAKRTKAVSLLLAETNVNVKFANLIGYTALHYSAAGGDEDITRLLLTYRADLHARTADGNTPEMLARASLKPNVEKILNLLKNPSQRNLKGQKKKKRVKQLIPPPRKSWQQELKEKVDSTVAKIAQDELKKLHEPTTYLEPSLEKFTPQQLLNLALKNKSIDKTIQLFTNHNELLTPVNVASSFKLGILQIVCEEIFKKKLLQSKAASDSSKIFAAYLKGVKAALAEHRSKEIGKKESKQLKVAEEYLALATNTSILMPSVPQIGATPSASPSGSNNPLRSNSGI